MDKIGNIIFSGSTNKDSTHRNFLKPNYFINSTIFEKDIRKIPAIDIMIDYIFKHELYNIVLEFCVFDKPVGINSEKVVIYEARTNY